MSYSRVIRETKRVLVVGLTASLLAAPAGNAFARGGHGGEESGGHEGGHEGGHRGEDGEGHRHGVGTIVRDLPRGHNEIFVGGRSFFYHEGRFFNRHRDGFIVVRAPIGAIVATLPIGFATFVFGGVSYYVADEAYYRRTPEGYVVVEPPVQ